MTDAVCNMGHTPVCVFTCLLLPVLFAYVLSVLCGFLFSAGGVFWVVNDERRRREEKRKSDERRGEERRGEGREGGEEKG